MALEPPPRIVEKFQQIWRDWLYFLYEFIDEHTGGSGPTLPATGTSWNAHGNTAISDATNPLKIEDAAFWAEGDTGNTPVSWTSGVETRLMWIPAKAAFRAGSVESNNWDNAKVGQNSVSIGFDGQAIGQYGVSLGNKNSAGSLLTDTAPIAIGQSCTALANFTIAIGVNSDATALNSTAIGTDNTSSGNNSVSIGSTNTATNTQSTSIGVGNNTTGVQSTSVGRGITTSGQGSASFGVDLTNDASLAGFNFGWQNISSGSAGGTIGAYCESSAQSAWTIGQGVLFGSRLNNNIENSMMLGVGAATPTITLRNSRAGIGPTATNPLSTLDIRGSVGAKYDLLTGSNGGSDTLSDEYVVHVDMQSVTGGNIYTVNLPALGATTIDRRVYYIKVISLSGTYGGGTALLRLQPSANDGFEDLTSGGTPGTLLADNTPVDLGMSGANRGLSLTIQADNDNGGWWVI